MQPEAFEAFYEQWYGPILNFCWRRLSSFHEAEDVTHDVFARAWKSWDGFDGADGKNWIYRIAKNACIDLARHRQLLTMESIHTLKVNGWSLSSVIADDDRSPESLLIGQEDTMLIQQAIQMLPKHHQVAVMTQLRFGGTRQIGLVPAVGGQLGLSDSAASALLVRSRRQLAKVILEIEQQGQLAASHRRAAFDAMREAA